jgi:hypothetical protein
MSKFWVGNVMQLQESGGLCCVFILPVNPIDWPLEFR